MQKPLAIIFFVTGFFFCGHVGMAQSLDEILIKHVPEITQGNQKVQASQYPTAPEKVGKSREELLAAYEKLLTLFEELVKKLTNVPGASGKPVATNTNKPAPAAKPGSHNYTVARGDSLWKIAQKQLGDGSRYWEIVEANKAKYPSLAKNPNLIYPGWNLTIPGAGTSSNPPSSGGTTVAKPPSSDGTTPPSSNDSTALLNWKGGKLSPAEFVRILGPACRESAKRTGVPASVTLAQAALETGWGGSTIGNAKNLFGIKGTGPAGSITVPTREWENGRYVTVQGSFRKYNNWGESIDDHAKLVSQGARYKNCMANKNNPDQFARELQKAGYATSPTYAATLISIMKTHNLYQYDK